MKVLKYGEGYPKTCTCGKCKSELEYTITDIHHTTELQLVQDPLVKEQLMRIEYVVCPVCGRTVDIFTAPIYMVEDDKKSWWKR